MHTIVTVPLAIILCAFARHITFTLSYIFRNMIFHLQGNLHLSKKNGPFHFRVTFSVRAFAGGWGGLAVLVSY